MHVRFMAESLYSLKKKNRSWDSMLTPLPVGEALGAEGSLCIIVAGPLNYCDSSWASELPS